MASNSDYVRDDNYGLPVIGAIVKLFTRNGLTFLDETTTDREGRYTFTRDDGFYTVSVSYGGITNRSDFQIGIPPEIKGDAGPADNTYTTLAALLASDPSRKSARLVPQAGETAAAGNYNYLNGAWVLQQANGVGYAAPFAQAASRTVEAQLSEGAVDLAAFKGTTDADKLANAVASGRIVRLTKGAGSFGSDGDYVMSTQFAPTVAPRSKVRLFSDDGAVIRMDQTEQTVGRNAILIDSGSDTTQIEEVWVRGLTLRDDVAALGFAEFRYLLAINGASRIDVSDTRFIGFRGDGLYVGPLRQADRRPNRSVVVEKCYFDGINTNNRNGISIISARGVTIRDSEFWRTTRRGGTGAFDPMNPNTGLSMPGGIDVEPNDYSYEWARNVLIERNLFNGIGGAGVRLWVSGNGVKDEPVGGYTVRNNDMQACRLAWSVTAGGTGAGLPGVDAADHNVVIDNNTMIANEMHFLTEGVRGLRVTRNTMIAGQMPSDLGYIAGLRDLTYDDNFHLGDGTQTEYALVARNLVGRNSMRRNRFIGTGKTNGSGGAVGLILAGTLEGLAYEDNTEVAAGRTTSRLVFVPGVNINRRTCTDYANTTDFTPVASSYQPYATDRPVPFSAGGGNGSIAIDRSGQVDFQLVGDSVTLPVTLPVAGAPGSYPVVGAINKSGSPLAVGEQNVTRVDANQGDNVTKVAVGKWASDGTETAVTGAAKVRVAGRYKAA